MAVTLSLVTMLQTPAMSCGKLGQSTFEQWSELMLKQNEGNIDRILRVTLGAVLISMVFFGPQTSWGWVGLVPLLTGLVGSCPVYSILGLSTLKKS